MLRGSNSVIYGSDAMTGVVNITTRRGRTRIPELTASLDGGNLGTSHEDVSVGGAVRRFDYFAGVSHLQTDNSVPNNAYRNNTVATRFGVMLGTNTDLSGTVRWIDAALRQPQRVRLLRDRRRLVSDAPLDVCVGRGAVADHQPLAEHGAVRRRRPGLPLREPVADRQSLRSVGFANFLGNVVTITGANGYSVTGRAILDFGGTFPSPFDSTVTRRSLLGQTGYHVSQALDVSGGVRVEHEHGTSLFAGSLTETTRTNSGAFVEARASAMGRLYVTGGVGFDHNEIFGNVASPRVSVAAYLRQPSATESLGDTKVTFNAGKGIKEPSCRRNCRRCSC